jgi:hypothetical protein
MGARCRPVARGPDGRVRVVPGLARLRARPTGRLDAGRRATDWTGAVVSTWCVEARRPPSVCGQTGGMGALVGIPVVRRRAVGHGPRSAGRFEGRSGTLRGGCPRPRPAGRWARGSGAPSNGMDARGRGPRVEPDKASPKPLRPRASTAWPVSGPRGPVLLHIWRSHARLQWIRASPLCTHDTHGAGHHPWC